IAQRVEFSGLPRQPRPFRARALVLCSVLILSSLAGRGSGESRALATGEPSAGERLSFGLGQSQASGPGAQLLAHGDYKAAMTAFESALAQNPGDKAARDGLLAAQIEIGQYKEAETRVKEFLKAGADSSLLGLQGDLFLETGRYAEAAAGFERASEGSSGKDLLRALLGASRAL